MGDVGVEEERLLWANVDCRTSQDYRRGAGLQERDYVITGLHDGYIGYYRSTTRMLYNVTDEVQVRYISIIIVLNCCFNKFDCIYLIVLIIF